MTAPTSEADLGRDRADMERLVLGEPDALDQLILRHGESVHGYLLRILRDREDARDLALETFVRVHAHRAHYDPRKPFRSWLYSIASNLARDRLRWRRRHPESPLEALPSNPTARSTADNHSDPGRAPDSELLRQETALAVRRAVGELPVDLRLAVVLAEFENQSTAEIAIALSCSAKAIEMRLYRARQLLRNRLKQWIL